MAEDERPMKLGRIRYRPTPRAVRWPPLDEETILEWADAHYERTGEWPLSTSGVTLDSAGERWSTISQALRLGVRTLPGGSSLARLLAQHRGYRNRKGLPAYTEAQILAWCDAHFARQGEWPNAESGPIEEAPGENWCMVSNALAQKTRGITTKTTIAQLLEVRRGVVYKRPRLTLESILFWVDAYYARIGEWPTLNSLPIKEMEDETWETVNRALRRGFRGIRLVNCSLARLLEQQRGQPNRLRPPQISEEQVLAWADDYHARTGKWPKAGSGAIAEPSGLTWAHVNSSLIQGVRGFLGGSSLPRLLAAHRGVPNQAALPGLREESILQWADDYHARRKRWPNVRSGPVEEAPAETWANLNNALEQGSRGLPGNSSLARLLADKRGHRNPMRLPNLSVEQILSWADAHFEQSGRWPSENSGSVPQAPGETWMGITTMLRVGRRGITGGSSLALLLAERRGRRFNQRTTELSREEILEWADAYRARTGRWPTTNSGEVAGVPGQTWSAVNVALEHGLRGLEAGDSLARLLARERNKRNRASLPPLSEETILLWAQSHCRRTGKWPTQKSGSIAEAPDETWGAIDTTLETGRRGLPGGASLPILLDRIRKPGLH